MSIGENANDVSARANLGLRALAFVLDTVLASASAWTLFFVFFIKWRYPSFVEDYSAFLETATSVKDFAHIPADIAIPFRMANIAVGVGVFLYFFLSDWLWSGRTLGKRFVRLRAVRQTPFGEALSPLAAFVRAGEIRLPLLFAAPFFQHARRVYRSRTARPARPRGAHLCHRRNEIYGIFGT